VLLIQADGSFPNLALMKLSSWHKRRGDQVYYANLKIGRRSLYKGRLERLKTVSYGKPNRIYVSVVFSWNSGVPKAIEAMHPDAEVIAGGYMYDPSKKLPQEVEHTCPDYAMYGLDYSLGFTSRGCNRKCPWCYVWRFEGSIEEWSPLEEFVRHRKVILLDNNFLQSPRWKEKLLKLIAWRCKVCFSQGLDIKLVNDKVAQLLSKLSFWNHNFTRRQLYFAWDNLKEEKWIRRGIETLKAHGVSQPMFYVLCGYNTTLEDDLYRVERLLDWGCDPYLMLYNRWEIRHPPELRRLARYINRRIYKRYKIGFEDYLRMGAPCDRKLVR